MEPANIVVGAFGQVQLMDWGSAKVLIDEILNRQAKTKINARTDPSR